MDELNIESPLKYKSPVKAGPSETPMEMPELQLEEKLQPSRRKSGFSSDEEPEIKEEPKRKRGRPRRGEAPVKKPVLATRKSRRIVDNPKPVAKPPVAPKPLKLLILHSPPAQSLTTSSTGRQKPLSVDAERLYTSSAKDRRFNLNTLDVLTQFVEEFQPKGAKNEVVSENTVLAEFKAHLLYSLRQLLDVHATIKDISHDIFETQRQKQQIRRDILEAKKEHAGVGTALNLLRADYNSSKQRHTAFSALAESLGQISAPSHSLSQKVLQELRDMDRIHNRDQGLLRQLEKTNRLLQKKLS